MQRTMRLVAGSAAVMMTAMAVNKVVQVGAEFERLRATLTSVTGSTKNAEIAFQAIQDIASTTPFQVTDLTDTFIRLKSFGLDPLDGSMQDIIDTAAALGGSQEQLDGIALALGQAWAKQKLQGEEILQLIERGVPVWEVLQDITGKNVDELQKLSSAGELGRDVIKQLMDELGRRNIGAAAEQANTLNGAFSNLEDAVSRVIDKLGRESGFLGLIRDATVWVTRFVDAFSADDGAAKAMELFQTKIEPNIALIRDLGIYMGAFDPTSLEDVMRVITAAEMQGVDLGLEAQLSGIQRQIDATATSLRGLYIARDALAKSDQATDAQRKQNAQTIKLLEDHMASLAKQYQNAAGGAQQLADANDQASQSNDNYAQRMAEVERIMRQTYTETDKLRDEVYRMNALFLAGDLPAETYNERIRQLAGASSESTAAVRENNDALSERNRLIMESQRVIDSTMTDEQRWAQEITRLNELWQLGADQQNVQMGIGIDTETYMAAVEQANARFLESQSMAAQEYMAIWEGAGYRFSQIIGDAVSETVFEQKDFVQTLNSLVRSFMKQLLSELVAYSVRRAALWAMEKAGIIGTTAVSTGAALTTATAWAPAAAAVSLATMGGNAPLANAGIASTFALSKTLALSGMAHDGLDYVPREGTFLLQKGERVVNRQDNHELSRALKDGRLAGGGVTVVQNFSFSAVDAAGMQTLLAKMAPAIKQIAVNGVSEAMAARGRSLY